MPVSLTASVWQARMAIVAPEAPVWLSAGVAKALANPGAADDGLLLIAGVLDEAADVAVVRNPFLSRDIGRLAEMCRIVVARRARDATTSSQ